ncbi:MAG TPA: TetR/AcrR family transcriptional regulator [Candidatus Aminicenantes bacterium]|nr:TetR/AcrR family transcriptional regulator [Candidatus Aminicenantes bacterium]
MKKTDVRRERELRRREGYRGHILQAAKRVILRTGYSALTMDDVAREARLSKATVYKYVAGKGALLLEILGHSFDHLRERLGLLVEAVLRSGEDMSHFNRVLGMDKAILKLMRVFVTAPGRAGAATPADRKLLAMVKHKRQEMIEVGARVLEAGIASGEFRSMDPRQAATFVEAALQGYMHMRVWQSGTPLSPTAAEGLTRFIIEGIRNPDLSGKEA